MAAIPGVVMDAGHALDLLIAKTITKIPPYIEGVVVYDDGRTDGGHTPGYAAAKADNYQRQGLKCHYEGRERSSERYSTDLAAAFGLVHYMHADGFEVRIQSFCGIASACYKVLFVLPGRRDEAQEGIAWTLECSRPGPEQLCLAICRAALLTKQSVRN